MYRLSYLGVGAIEFGGITLTLVATTKIMYTGGSTA